MCCPFLCTFFLYYFYYYFIFPFFIGIFELFSVGNDKKLITEQIFLYFSYLVGLEFTNWIFDGNLYFWKITFELKTE